MKRGVISIYPYLGDSKTPSSEIRYELSMAPEEFWWQGRAMDEWMYVIQKYHAPREADPQREREAYTFRVHDETGGNYSVFCNEEEIICLMLHYLEDHSAVTVKEVRYKGITYKGIDRLSAPYTDDTTAFRLYANRKSRPAEVYLFGPGVHQRWFKDDFGDADYEYAAADRGSCGVVETNENRVYAGARSFKPCARMMPEENPKQDARADHGEEQPDFLALHLFLETNGEDITFSVLYGGRLCPKISRNDQRVVFYDTPDDASGACGREEAFRDIIFESIDGEYQYTPDSGAPDILKRKFNGVVFTPPETPDRDQLDRASASALYTDYLNALYTALAGAKEYRTGAYVFRREDTGSMLCAKIDGFTLYGKLEVPDRADESGRWYSVWFNPWDQFIEDSDLSVQRAAFSRSGIEIALVPMYCHSSPLNIYLSAKIEVNDEEQHSGSFDELNKRGFFSRVRLPETVQFDWHFTAFMKHIEVYKKIRQAMLDASMQQFLRDLTGFPQELGARDMEKLLYGEGLEPDPDVISLVMELQTRYNDTGRIPNIAMIGEAGTGKSTMAVKIARVLFNKGLMVNSPSDLKAPYVGQSKYETLSRLIEAARHEEIFFIDEAYTLMQDSFGLEAVSFLLPLMTDSQNVRTLEARLNNATLSADFINGRATFKKDEKSEPLVTKFAPGVPPIWIAGYEDDIRLMLYENQGLYRRFRRVTLKTPTTGKLYEELLKKTRQLIQTAKDGSATGDKARILLNLFEKKADLIKKFFQWGAQPQNSKYFASHAGVENFLDRCLYGVDFSSGQSEENIAGQMETVISQIKRDIRNQLDTLRRKGDRRGAAGVEDGDRVEMVTDIKTRFKDLIGCDAQIRYMNTIIQMLVHKSFFDERAMTVSRGALLLGRPGVGKTFIASAMAGELQERFEKEAPDKHMGFMSLSAPELTAREPGFIRSVFDKAEEYDACVIFIDEVDAIAKKRSKNDCYSHFIELIKQMDGIEQRSNVFVLAATNAPEFLDPAFTRSGRIDQTLTFDLPDRDDRLKLAERSLTRRCGKLPMFDVEENRDGVHGLAKKLAAITPGYTPGDIENIVNTAFILYYQEEERSPSKVLETKDLMECLYRYLYEAVERKRIGELRPKGEETFSVAQNNESRSSAAVHEVGHALVEILRGCEPFEKITVLPRGSALGYVTPTQNPDVTKADYENRIRSIMGGRIAEEIVYGADNISVGASSDIQKATRLARYMVEEVGFASEFGFMSLKESTARYLGEGEYICSEAFRKQSDEAVNELLKRLYQETKSMLEDKKELIVTLAGQVFKRETMTGQEFLQLYREKWKG